ncbi:MAG: cytochrome c [Proteobacteria bacterium]|nr:cytochrome c [Pseudomonadota bacterium]
MKNGWITRNRIIAAMAGGAFVFIVGGAWLLIYAGAYNIAADAPHTGPVYWLLNNVRERSVAVRSAGIEVPADLRDPKRIAAGAGLYNEMCSGCHLAPGMERTEISQGLYPRAPEFSRGTDLTPQQEFWTIKHGIKMTGMAAWGPTHNDTLIWDMVAFLQKLPALTPAQYKTIVKSAPEDHDDMMRDMPGMKQPDDGDHH